MNVDEFAELSQKGEGKFRVTKVILRAEGQVIRGQGLLHVNDKEFELDLDVTQRYETPEPKRDVWKPADAWKLSGLIEGDLKFSCDQVSPSGKYASWPVRRERRYVQKLRFKRVDLIPAGLDALSSAQRDKILKRPHRKKPKFPKVQFDAVIPGCKPVIFNAGTITKIRNDFLGLCRRQSSFDTFIDRNKEYDFGLIKKEEDMHVHFRSKSRFHSASEEDDWRRFYALLFAIGFTHGFQPWPCRIEYWRSGKKITDRITIRQKLTKTPHAPFDEQIGYLGNFRRKGSQNSVIRLAARFFEKQTTLSQKLSHLLFLFREAGSSSFHIRTLAFCSLFEGIVSLIFDELKLENVARGRDSQFDNYLKLRDRLAGRLRKLSSRSNNPAYDRMVSLLSSANEFRVKDKFRAVSEHFRLDYEKDMISHFNAWRNKRNPFSHGNLENSDSDFSDQALIAGAINILVLKLIGYSGPMKFNAFSYEEKDRYKRI
jgi:hypothetical protein